MCASLEARPMLVCVGNDKDECVSPVQADDPRLAIVLPVVGVSELDHLVLRLGRANKKDIPTKA